jgi:uncharacterized protein
MEILLSALLLGLVSAGHCAGMCGGIVAAFTLQSIPAKSLIPLHLAYNFGRILTYSALGGIAGALGGATLLIEHAFPIQSILRMAANLMLVALGFYLMGFTRFLAPIEHAGYVIWRLVQPLTRSWLPADRPHRALALGVLWGFLPCGLVYSVMVTSLASGGTRQGALTMLAFGLGTLPALLCTSLLFRQGNGLKNFRVVRAVFGTLIMALGFLGLIHAMHHVAV